MANEQSPGIEALIKGVLDDPARMAQLQGIMSALGNSTPAPTAEAEESSAPADAPAESPTEVPNSIPTVSPELLSGLLKNPELLSRLPALLSMTGKQEGAGGDHAPAKSHGPDHRTALLLALKPYLNDGRREMIDYIVNLSRLGNLLNR